MKGWYEQSLSDREVLENSMNRVKSKSVSQGSQGHRSRQPRGYQGKVCYLCKKPGHQQIRCFRTRFMSERQLSRAGLRWAQRCDHRDDLSGEDGPKYHWVPNHSH